MDTKTPTHANNYAIGALLTEEDTLSLRKSPSALNVCDVFGLVTTFESQDSPKIVFARTYNVCIECF